MTIPCTIHHRAAPVFCRNGTVRFAGTETSHEFGGYLEGALASADRAVRKAL
ncbi:MAG: FAD-dependent oxidoreductase [Desulfotignum sp.]|nr:FAD-dependent oxidoreductase [Desulfotignum sp.]